MKPGKYDIEVNQGGTYESGAISRTVEGVSLNFGVYTAMTLRVKQAWKHTGVITDDEPLLEISMASGHIIVAGDELSISIVIPTAEIDAYTFESGRYFLDLHTATLDHKLLYGKFTVIGEDDI